MIRVRTGQQLNQAQTYDDDDDDDDDDGGTRVLRRRAEVLPLPAPPTNNRGTYKNFCVALIDREEYRPKHFAGSHIWC